MESKNNSGVALVLVIVLLATVVTMGINYLQVLNVTRDDRVSRFRATQALYLAEAAVEEGWWYMRNISPNFTGMSEVRALFHGEYLFNIVNSKNIVGYGFVPSKTDALVMRTVTYNSKQSLVNAATHNIEGYNYAVWLGPDLGIDFNWRPTLKVIGGSVHTTSRNIVFSGSGDKIVDRTVQASGTGVTIDISAWSGGNPAEEIVTTDEAVIISHNYDLLIAIADTEYGPGKIFTGTTTENPLAYPGVVYVSQGDIQFQDTLTVYSGNITIISGPKGTNLAGAIEIWGDLNPRRDKDTMTLISGSYIKIKKPNSGTMNIRASLYAQDYIVIEGSGPVNIYGNLAIGGNSGETPLQWPSDVTVNVYYDSRYFIPSFVDGELLPNPALPYWIAQ